MLQYPAMKYSFTYKTNIEPQKKREKPHLELTPPRRWATIKQITQWYAGTFNEGTIRWLIVKKDHNGFASCMGKIGRKIIIDIDLFEKWIDEQISK